LVGLRAGAMFGLTLAARGQLRICLTCDFQDRDLSCHRFVSAQDDLDVEWIQLAAAAASAGLFAGDERRSRTEEWVDDDVAAFGHIEQGIFQHGNRLDGRVVLPAFARLSAQARSGRIGPEIRSPTPLLAALDVIKVGCPSLLE